MTKKQPAKTFAEATAKRMAKLTPEQKQAWAERMQAALRKKKKAIGAEAFSKLQAKAGRKGGKARAAILTDEQKREIAMQGGLAKKPRKGKDDGKSK